MEFKQYFHMNDGDGELSYSQNCSAQEEAWLKNYNLLKCAIQSLLSEESILEDGLNVADLGCGVGPVPLAFVTLVIDCVKDKYKEMKRNNKDVELQIYMNDLPSNDFNMLFKKLLNLEQLKRIDDRPLCFLMATPGSYYDRLFRRKSLHFVHACYTLHWFSQAPAALSNEQGEPINKGNVYISEASSNIVAKIYLSQFEQDFTQFLKCRSEEMVPKGRMLITVRGRPNSSNFLTWQPWELKIFAKTLTNLVSEGLIKEDKLDIFNFPYYCACEDELENIVKKQGSFEIEIIKTIAHHVAKDIEDKWKRSKSIANFIRAFSESLISHHFGDDVLNPLYDKLCHCTYDYLEDGQLAEHHTVTILLKKI